MTLANSGILSTGNGVTGQDISIELGRPGTVVNICTDADCLALIGKTAGQTVHLSDYYGKSKFTSKLNIYTSGSGVETVPSGATNVVIEIWGGGGGGGNSSNTLGGGGGGSGGYSKSSYSITGSNTLNYSVGTGGTGGIGGTTSTVTSGTKTITTMTANGGSGGSRPTPGSGGSATGGNLINTTGNSGEAGEAGEGSGFTAPGGAGITGSSGTYGAGGDGGPRSEGDGTGFPGTSGNNGAVVFYYTE